MSTYAVTFRDYTPIARADGSPFASALIYESDAETGPWTLVETAPLSPVDVDPANPATRTLTTENATLQNGWYKIVWQDSGGSTSETPPIQNLGGIRAYRPFVSDVAAWLQGRTVDSNSSQVGTFTAATRPTFEQALRVIDLAMDKLEAKFGPSMNPELVGSAKSVVALRAAMLIELTFFADQIRADRSPYAELKALYEESLTDWLAERLQLGADATPDTADDTSASGLPVSFFPPLCPPDSAIRRFRW